LILPSVFISNSHMYLVDFTAAQFYDTTFAGERFDEVLGKPLEELQMLCDPRHANTASAAVLRDNLPTLPADEACAIIYTAIQVNFPDNVVNYPLACDDPVDVKIWPDTRDLWSEQWDLCSTPTIAAHVNTIVESLAKLEQHRADPTYTVEQMNEAVLMAIEAVYSLKHAVYAIDAARAGKDVVVTETVANSVAVMNTCKSKDEGLVPEWVQNEQKRCASSCANKRQRTEAFTNHS